MLSVEKKAQEQSQENNFKLSQQKLPSIPHSGKFGQNTSQNISDSQASLNSLKSTRRTAKERQKDAQVLKNSLNFTKKPVVDDIDNINGQNQLKFSYKPTNDYSFADKNLLDNFMSGQSRNSHYDSLLSQNANKKLNFTIKPEPTLNSLNRTYNSRPSEYDSNIVNFENQRYDYPGHESKDDILDDVMLVKKKTPKEYLRDFHDTSDVYDNNDSYLVNLQSKGGLSYPSNSYRSLSDTGDAIKVEDMDEYLYHPQAYSTSSNSHNNSNY